VTDQEKWKLIAYAKRRHKRRETKKDEPLVTVRVICLNKRHAITLTKRGRMILDGHNTLEKVQATQIQELIGCEKARCLEIKRMFVSDSDVKASRRRQTPRIKYLPPELRQAARELNATHEVRSSRETPEPIVPDKVWLESRSYGNGYLYSHEKRSLGFPSNVYMGIAERVLTQVVNSDICHSDNGIGGRSKVISSLQAHLVDNKRGGTATVYDRKNGKHRKVEGACADGYAFYLTNEWVRDIYLRFNKQVVLGNKYLLLDVGDEVGQNRYTARACARVAAEYSSWSLGTVKGTLYQRPFGGWSFMEDEKVIAPLPIAV
jgi:hypothetical protein